MYRIRKSNEEEQKSQLKKYTTLKILIELVLNQIKVESWLKRSVPMAKIQDKDTTKYCAFHKDCGHYTSDCGALKKIH